MFRSAPAPTSDGVTEPHDAKHTEVRSFGVIAWTSGGQDAAAANEGHALFGSTGRWLNEPSVNLDKTLRNLLKCHTTAESAHDG
jgi:hypothetical protein